MIEDCSLNLNGLDTIVNLNISPLGSYDELIEMEWLETHHVILNCLVIVASLLKFKGF